MPLTPKGELRIEKQNNFVDEQTRAIFNDQLAIDVE